MSLATCTICKNLKPKINTGLKNSWRGFKYRDDKGKLWHSSQCPDCKRILDTKYARQRGHKAIDDVQTPHMKHARQNEIKAQKWLLKNGYQNVILGHGKGPDLFAQHGDETLCVEVKSVINQSSSQGLFVHPVYKTRFNDDLIIYVYKRKCIMRLMSEHLKNQLQNKYGTVSVTKYFRPAGVKRFEIEFISPELQAKREKRSSQ